MDAWDRVMNRAFDKLWDDWCEYQLDPAAHDAKMALTHDRIPASNASGFIWWPKDWK